MHRFGSRWQALMALALGALVVGVVDWLGSSTPQEPQEVSVEPSPLHEAVRNAARGDVSAAVARSPPDSFEDATAVLAEAAKVGQRFPRPIRIYAPLDRAARREAVFGEYVPIIKLRIVLSDELKLAPSEAVAGTCTELTFDAARWGKRWRLPVHLFRSPDGTVRVYADTRNAKCW